MEIYIEYAFIENFLFDYTLLYLALLSTKTEIRRFRLVIASVFGGVFAILFPLLYLPKILGTILKISVGFLLCFMAVKDIKTKKDRDRYALTCIFFFIFSFSFGGILLALTRDFFQNKVPSLLVISAFAMLTYISIRLIKKLQAQKAVYAYLYDCKVMAQGVCKEVQGFWDSGNLAIKNNIMVCFLSPELFYDIFQGNIFAKGRGQVCDELEIRTVSGVKNVAVYLGEIEVKTHVRWIKKQVYFAPSKNMLSKTYSLLLPSGIFEGYEEENIAVKSDERGNQSVA